MKPDKRPYSPKTALSHLISMSIMKIILLLLLISALPNLAAESPTSSNLGLIKNNAPAGGNLSSTEPKKPILAAPVANGRNSTQGQETAKPVKEIWRPLASSPEGGLFAERLNVWRQGRLWYVLTAQNDYLLSGFESRPGRHPWQGEHLGKWLDAATLAYEQTHEEKLLKALQVTVQRLLATQEANGYLGTYGPENRFTAWPENLNLSEDVAALKPKRGGWDTWTFRYNIYGLLTYERFHPDSRVVESCRKMADLLIEVYGEGKADLTQYGNHKGIAAISLLESIVLLYERTQDKKYLDFALHIVALTEKNPMLRLMGNMLEKKSLVYSGKGKAYELMANLMGYLLLYKSTGDERYLKTVQNAWEEIKTSHLDVTGGPWSKKAHYNASKECFALSEDYNPDGADIETCSTTSWIELNLHLLELTGQARYAVEAERSIFNSLMAAQYKEGIDWCYFTRANEKQRPYESEIKCCLSSGPRALERFSHDLIGEVEGAVSFTTLVPCSAVLSEVFGKAKIQVTGNYPIRPNIKIHFDQAVGKEFALEFHDPADSQLKSVRINGREITLSKNDRGYYRVSQSWKTGDEITIDFEYQLKSHFALPKEDGKWVAFTYGPWALAQTTVPGVALAEPLIGKDFSSTAASQWLEAQPTDKNSLPRFRIKDTEILMGPFYSAGSKSSGPRTYFKIAAPKSESLKPPRTF